MDGGRFHGFGVSAILSMIIVVLGAQALIRRGLFWSLDGTTWGLTDEREGILSFVSSPNNSLHLVPYPHLVTETVLGCLGS